MAPRFDGIQAVAEMMNLLDDATRARLMGDLEARSPDTAQRVRDRMFTFFDLLRIAELELQKVLRLLPRRKIALAMRGLDEEYSALIFAAVGSRGAEALKDEIMSLGPQKLSAVEEARRDLALLVLKLAAEGQISLK